MCQSAQTGTCVSTSIPSLLWGGSAQHPCPYLIELVVSDTYAKAHLSTEKAKARPNTRVPCTLKNTRRTQRSPCSSPQGSRKTHCLGCYMLPRRLRLSRAALSDPRGDARATSAHFSLTSNPAKTGCAVIVSKKTEKSSVGRHRLKRQVLALVAPFCRKGYSLVVYARKGSNTLSSKALAKEVGELLTKLPPLPPVR